MQVETIFLILLLFSASALCIALIIYLGKITRSMTAIENDIKTISFQVTPLVASITNLSEKLITVTHELQEPIENVGNIVNDVRDRVDVILEFEEKLRTSVQKPVTEFTSSLNAIVTGINAFWKRYKNN